MSVSIQTKFWSMLFFFFSSRRRHTRCGRDWSSDVCSSDLWGLGTETPTERFAPRRLRRATTFIGADGTEPRDLRSRAPPPLASVAVRLLAPEPLARSEERRVGKEWRSRGSPDG